MKDIFKYLSVFSVLVLGLSACEQIVDLPLPEYEPQIATYGILSVGENPKILVNQSSSYFDPIDRRDLMNVIIDATVSISDGSQNWPLEFDSISFYIENFYDSELNSWVVDTIPFGSYTTDAFLVEINKTYELEISHNDKKLTGTTSIPAYGEIISSSHETTILDDAFSGDLICWATAIDVMFSDPSDSNFYEIKWWQETWQKSGVTGDSILIDRYYWGSDWLTDESFNGTTTSYSTQVGYNCDFDGPPEPDPDPSFWSIIEMRITSISKEAYTFKISMDQQWDSEGNPFSEPVPLNSTVEGGIGLFGSSVLIGEPIRVKVTY